jgi:hypothetical protein
MVRAQEGLRRLSGVPVPPALAARLQVAASYERARLLTRRNIGIWTRHMAGRCRLMIDNLMRPVALPFAGGLLSALVLFSMLVPTLVFERSVRNDVPITFLFTGASLEEITPFALSEHETVLELTIDERGRVTDYSVRRGVLTPDMVNVLLFSRFTPATAFGQPTWGKFKVTFRRTQNTSDIVVRG